ncbi:hypothetical protein [Trichlorobacter lovleyi]|uniref:Uncharacterized protein n=1 Tax=Trichlorobacter lovleyi (strain ATCC BAA-1151 / DSM 17278 / SZ) TaxID=398767 RepID=B3E8L1_TRIL1|nr:hypothetical protein [Trichlorobacter lovleyi]ACD96687.1 hypothetical protein Glov_2981 [Trichlorobacter lovleyi SZ]
MQTLPAAITAEKNKTTGAKPVWILKLSRTGTTPLYISDRVLTITAADGTSQTTKAWVSSWGVLKEGITNGLGEMTIADYDLHLMADPTDAANIIYQVDTYDIETSTAEIQHWYEGMVAGTAAIKKFVGYVKEVSVDQNDEGVSLRLQDATLKLQGTLGTVLDSVTYPLADPDHIGKLLPIVFGTVNKLPALCVDAGWVTSLANQALSTDTTITVSELPSTTVVGKTFYIDAEQVTVTAANTTTRVLTVTRGVNGTTIANHSMGSVVIEKKATPIVFILADHALDTIGEIYIRVAGVDVNITASVTKYLGTSGNQLAAYPGKAAITIATTPAVMQQIWLAINNALDVDQGNHTHPTSTSTTVLRPNNVIYVYGGTLANNYNGTYAQRAFDNDTATYMQGNLAVQLSQVCDGTYNASPGFTYTTVNNIASCLNIRVGVVAECGYDYGSPVRIQLFIKGVMVLNQAIGNVFASGTFYTGWYPFTNMSDLYSYPSTSFAKIVMQNGSDCRCKEIWFEIQTGTATTYSPAAGVALTGDLSLIGNSIANVYTMDQLMANVARTTVATPLLACNDILSRVGYPAATGSSNITTAINGAITTQQSALYWLTRIAFESWALFKVSSAGSKLVPRGAGASQKPITSAMVRNSSRRKSAYEDIINKIALKFDLDYASTSADPYRQTVSDVNSASQTRYGVQDRPDLFLFQFITSSAIATALRDAYLTWYAARHWVHEVEVFLDNIEVEFGDSITLGFITGAPVGFVREARVAPGDDSAPDTITLVVEV